MTEDRIEYELAGIVTATSWFGQKGVARVRILTDEKGLENIKANPLQDYLSFGVMSVDYVKLDVFKIKTKVTRDKIIQERSKRPDFTIEKGECKLTPKVKKILSEIQEITVRY
jgi:hypothetical protein